MSCSCWQKQNINFPTRAPGDEDDFTIWMVDVSIMAFIMTWIYVVHTKILILMLWIDH